MRANPFWPPFPLAFPPPFPGGDPRLAGQQRPVPRQAPPAQGHAGRPHPWYPAYTGRPGYAAYAPYAPYPPYPPYPASSWYPAPTAYAPPPRTPAPAPERADGPDDSDDGLVLGTFRPLSEPEPRRRAAAHRAPRRKVLIHSSPSSDGGGLRRLLPQALVIAVLAGGTAAFVAGDKAVRLTVDGRTRTLHTFADDVGELLAAQGLRTGSHDQVAPTPATDLTSGDEITVQYGRPLALTLDGHRAQVWTTARTVGGALRGLGIPLRGAQISVPRSRPVPRSGLALEVRTERAVTFRADGRAQTVRTTALTVGQALTEAGIVLRGWDVTSVPLGGFPRDGETVTVLRVTGYREVREESVPYDVIRVPDAALSAGTETVDRQGSPGLRRVTYELRTVNGVRQRPRQVADEQVRAPVAHRVRVGTGPAPRAAALSPDGLDWAALAQCESGGRPGAVDGTGTHGGLYQFDTGTWRSLGGSGRPQDAPAAEQTHRAKRLYQRRGAAPWPHCGRTLFR
nr:ubiquitin-like domain-containing protein [Streptomyces sp. YSPA8]